MLGHYGKKIKNHKATSKTEAQDFYHSMLKRYKYNKSNYINISSVETHRSLSPKRSLYTASLLNLITVVAWGYLITIT